MKATEKTFELGLEDIEPWTGRLVSGESTYEAAGVAFEKNDVLFGKLRPYLAKVYRAEQQGQAVGDFIVLRPSRNVHPKFLTYNLLEQRLIDRLTAGSYGSKMPRTNWDDLGSQPILLPPFEEQCRIAAFLDYETARIDELVQEQQRLLYQAEKRFIARMSNALTKGVRVSPDVRATAVPWIPQVKSDWQVVPFKRLVVMQRGLDLPRQDRIAGSIPVISSGGVIDHHAVAAVKGPGIITGRYGTIGEVVYIEEDYWPLNTALYSREFNGNSVRFAFHVLRWLKPQVESLAAKAAVSGVDRNDLHQLFIALPPLEEQMEIAAYLDKSLEEVRELSRSLNDLAVLLSERRSALIAAAVTGQLDLRDWQPPASRGMAEVV